MRSVLTTRTEIHDRFLSLLSEYKISYDKIAGLTEDIGKYIKDIDAQVSQGETFDDRYVKILLGNLNMEQTHLVNVLKRMNELHAKMGYLV